MGLGNSDNIQNRIPLTPEQIIKYFNFETVNYDFSSLYHGNDLVGKTSLDRADQLYLTLKNSKDINGPVILVAHSIGMFTAYEFAIKYPNMVSGVVSVDGTFPKNLKEVNKFLENMPDIQQMFLGQFNDNAGSLNEMILSSIKIEQSKKKAKNIPLIIVHDISGENGPELQALSDAGVEFWLDKFPSKYSKSVDVSSGHYIMLNKPEAVISAINEMLQKVCKN
ncbi:Alpha/beta hydrolase family protein [compost metagenome]